MEKLNINEINTIPFINRARANEIALRALNGNFELEPILGFLPFFDSNISNSIFKKAIDQNANIEKLLMAINPFTDKELNDIVAKKAIESGVSLETVIGKVFPFVSMSVANSIALYAIRSECNPESLINAAMPFVNSEIADRIVSYSIEKNVNPDFLLTRALPFISDSARSMVNKYLNRANANTKVNDNYQDVNLHETVEKKLVRIFNESGITFDLDKPDEPLDLDSLHYISIICEMENEFDVEIPDEIFYENKLSSFNDFMKLLLNLKGE